MRGGGREGDSNPSLYRGPGEGMRFHVCARVSPLRFLGTQVLALISNFYNLKNIQNIVFKIFLFYKKSVKSVLWLKD